MRVRHNLWRTLLLSVTDEKRKKIGFPLLLSYDVFLKNMW